MEDTGSSLLVNTMFCLYIDAGFILLTVYILSKAILIAYFIVE